MKLGMMLVKAGDLAVASLLLDANPDSVAAASLRDLVETQHLFGIALDKNPCRTPKRATTFRFQ